MSGNYIIYSNGILNQFSTYSVAHVTTGALTVATATLTSDSSVVNQTSPSGSVYTAYKDLWERLNDGQVGLIPPLTTSQITALTGIDDGVQVIDITLGRLDVCVAGAFVSSSGATSTSGTYGSMYENNTNGSAMDSTTHRWKTASAGNTATGMTFADVSTGDTVTVDTGGLGARFISFYASFTNSGGKLTTATLLVNGVASIITIGIQGDSGNHRGLAAGDTITLADGDVCTLEIVSETSSDTVKIYQCHVNFGNV